MPWIFTHRSFRKAGPWGLAFLFILLACQPNEQPKIQGPLADLIRPAHFPAAHYTHDQNPYSQKGFELGRKLFADPILSADGTVSCQSCHQQENAFSDRGHALSAGIEGLQGPRNSPPIFNMAWNTSFMWDGGVTHIEVMPFAPISNPVEMGADLGEVIEKLRAHPEYPALFQEAFGVSPLTDQHLFWALAQYMSNLVSANSKYDRFIFGTVAFSQEELVGLQLFRTHCESCHSEPLFTDFGFHNNGLDTVITDIGRFRITRDSSHLGHFKTPSLRNIALTDPYMHDGRFNSLEAVLEHYSQGILPSSTLSSQFYKNEQGFRFNPAQQKAIIAFLHTLTDEEFISDPKLSE